MPASRLARRRVAWAPRLCYQLHSDPGGALPKWLVNASSSGSVPALLRAVARRVTQPC